MGSTGLGAASAGPALAADERAVRAVVNEVSHAWGAGDAAAFVDHYAEEATAILPGFALLGKQDIHRAMAGAFAGQLGGSRRVHQVQRVRFPGDATAILTSRSATVFAGETEPPADRWSLATWVMSRRPGRWLIEAYHDCPAA